MKAERIKIWLEIIAIIIGGNWVIYTFVYEKWWIPNHAPVNIVSTLTMSRGAAVRIDKQHQIIPITLTLEAQNPAERTIDLLNCIIIVSGSNVVEYKWKQNEWEKAVNSSLLGKNEKVSQLFYNPGDSNVIAVISPFRGTDNQLDPKEKISRTYPLYIPIGSFDHFEAIAMLPHANFNSGIYGKWSFDKEIRAVFKAFWPIKDGKEIELPAERHGAFGLQMSTTRAQLYIGI